MHIRLKTRRTEILIRGRKEDIKKWLTENSTEQEEEKNQSQVYLVPGTGKITINKRDIDEYLGLETLKVIVRQPLVATETEGKFDVIVNVKAAVTQDRQDDPPRNFQALLEADADYRPILKKAGYLTRDTYEKA